VLDRRRRARWSWEGWWRALNPHIGRGWGPAGAASAAVASEPGLAPASWPARDGVCCSGPPTAARAARGPAAGQAAMDAAAYVRGHRLGSATRLEANAPSVTAPRRRRAATPAVPPPTRSAPACFEHGAWADRALHAARGALERPRPGARHPARLGAVQRRRRSTTSPAARRTPRRPADPPVRAALRLGLYQCSTSTASRPRRPSTLGRAWPTAMPRPPASSTRPAPPGHAREPTFDDTTAKAPPSPTRCRRWARRALVRRARRRRGPTAPSTSSTSPPSPRCGPTPSSRPRRAARRVPGHSARTTPTPSSSTPFDAHGHPLFDAGAISRSRAPPSASRMRSTAAGERNPRPVWRAGAARPPTSRRSCRPARRRRRAPLRPGRPAHPLGREACAPTASCGSRTPTPPTARRRPFDRGPRRPAVQRLGTLQSRPDALARDARGAVELQARSSTPRRRSRPAGSVYSTARSPRRRTPTRSRLLERHPQSRCPTSASRSSP